MQSAWSSPASAQTQPSDTPVPPTPAPPTPAPPTPAPGIAQPARSPVDDIVEKLLTSDTDEEDLRWLYSNADEYTPSELTGKPIPAPGLPQRGEGSHRTWDPRWRKFTTGNYILTGAAFVTAAAASFIPNTPSRWRNRNGFDEWGRRNLGVAPYDDALWARDLSDFLVSVNLTFPLLVDSLIVTDWYRQSSEVATQMALISTETIAVTTALQTVISGIVSRERPLVRDCGESIDARSEDCLSKDRYRSFFSGHSSNAFAAAALTCQNHMRHEVFGDAFADGLTCGVAMLSAGTAATMRVVGGRHYLSDVLMGAALGSATGFGVPLLLHYGGGPSKSKASSTDAASLHVLPLPNGIALGGEF